MDIVREVAKFVKGLKKSDRIAVFHHTDSDGICSGVIAAKSIERLTGRKVFEIPGIANNIIVITPPVIKQLKAWKINKLICTDLAVDQLPGTVKEVEKFAEILIIDHHKIYHNLSSPRTTFIKIEDKMPASLGVYELFSKIVNISDLDWLAAAGTIADGQGPRWFSFIGKVAQKYGLPIKGDVLASEFYSRLESIAYADTLGKQSECYKIVYKSNFGNITKRTSKYDVVKLEIKKWFLNFEKHAEFLPNDLVFYEFYPKYLVKSLVTDKICAKIPNKTLIVITPAGPLQYTLSARRMDGKLDVARLLNTATKSLPGGSGGGHAHAAGGTIRRSDLKKFKEIIIRLVNNRRT